MATSTQQLQQALARASGAPRPVYMEQVPDANINVRGGTGISLELEQLGVKKRKKQPLNLSASSSIDIQEALSPIIDKIDFNSPLSIENAKEELVNNIVQQVNVDLADLNMVKTPTVNQVGGDQVTDFNVSTPQDQPAFGIGSPAAQTVAQFGPSIVGATVAGASPEDLARGVATSAAFGALGPVGDLAKGINSLSKVSINNPFDMINFAGGLVSLSNTVKSLSQFSVSDQVQKVSSIVNEIVTDPIGSLQRGTQSFSNNLAYGTDNPVLNEVRGLPFDYSYNYVTDAVTGELATPKLGSAIASAVPGNILGVTAMFGEFMMDKEKILNEHRQDSSMAASGAFSKSPTGKVAIGFTDQGLVGFINDPTIGTRSVDLSEINSPKDILDLDLSSLARSGMTFEDPFYDPTSPTNNLEGFEIAAQYNAELANLVSSLGITGSPKEFAQQRLEVGAMTSMLVDPSFMAQREEERKQRRSRQSVISGIQNYFDNDFDVFSSVGFDANGNSIGDGFDLEEAYTSLTGSTTIGYGQDTQKTMGQIAETARVNQIDLSTIDGRNRVTNLINNGEGVDVSTDPAEALGTNTGKNLADVTSELEDVTNFGVDASDVAQGIANTKEELEADKQQLEDSSTSTDTDPSDDPPSSAPDDSYDDSDPDMD